MAIGKIKPRRVGAAAAFLDQRLAVGKVAFSLEELVKETGLSITAARYQLLRLPQRAVRPTRMHQFFIIVSPEHRAMGVPPVTWWLDDYFKWLGHPYYLALQSAAAVYGSASQAVQTTQVMTDRPRRPIAVGRIRIQFFVKRLIEFTPTQALDNAYAPLWISTPEATAFDLIRYASRIGGVDRAIETLTPIIPRLRIPELKQVLEAENEISTTQRLGYVLEQGGNTKLAEVVQAWLPSKLPLIPLVPTTSKRVDVSIIEKWGLLNNSANSIL